MLRLARSTPEEATWHPRRQYLALSGRRWRSSCERRAFRPGSKLEELIKENQDFSLLRPEEAHDQIRIPLWLRVQFRKRHPESTPTPGDPTGGYPLALRDLYLWMVEHQDLPVQDGDGKSNGN